MTSEILLSQTTFHALGWALVHSLWQGALVALAYSCFASLTRNSAAHVRYVAACAAMGLMLLLPAATATRALNSPQINFAHANVSSGNPSADSAQDNPLAKDERDAAESPGLRARGEVASSPSATFRRWAGGRLTTLVPHLPFFWLAGVLLLSMRFAGGCFAVRRLRRSARPVAAELQQVLSRLSQRLRVPRAVRLCQSVAVEVPTVLGHLRPVILLPASVLTGLSPQQLEAVLAHELAHVRRYDYLVNLLQTAVETLLFYHPAAWWLSRRARAEREHACDDAAVEATGDALIYARALTRLEQLRQRRGHAPALVMAANGGSLMQRIQRLVSNNPKAHSRSPLVVASALLVIFTCGVLTFAHVFAPAADTGAASPLADAQGAKGEGRRVAVTFVSIPAPNLYYAPRAEKAMRKKIASLMSHNIPAVGFVAARGLYKDGKLDEERAALLRAWVAAGFEVGNETYSHPSLYRTSLEDFKADVIRGEQALSDVLGEHGKRLRYFSYPFLNTGPDAATKKAFEEFIRARGYTAHPVTIDSMDWLFADAYLQARRREDEEASKRIAADYIPYMDGMMEFYEKLSRDTLRARNPAGADADRRPPQLRADRRGHRDAQEARLHFRLARRGDERRSLPARRHLHRRARHLLAPTMGDVEGQRVPPRALPPALHAPIRQEGQRLAGEDQHEVRVAGRLRKDVERRAIRA